MDENTYAEVIVPRKTKGWVIPAMIGMGVLTFGAFLLTFSVQFGWVSIIAIITAVFVGWRYIREEYEYIFVTDELTVSTIYSGVSRKKKLVVVMNQVETVERFRDEMMDQIKQNPNAVVEDFSSHMTQNPVYMVKYSGESKVHYLLIEPTERLLNVMWRCAPSKVKR